MKTIVREASNTEVLTKVFVRYKRNVMYSYMSRFFNGSQYAFEYFKR